jgi:hypothetical protein
MKIQKYLESNTTTKHITNDTSNSLDYITSYDNGNLVFLFLWHH